MLIAPRPADEAQRLQALRELLILDTPPEERFDRITRFVAEELEMPTALISLIDAERQWFKARVGLPVCEIPRDLSFCSHAILEPGLLVVEDLSLDPRFAEHPAVLRAPAARFYAGAPLRLPSGAVVGTLCVLDTRPRRLDRLGRAILGSLRDLVVEELLSRERESGA